MEIDRVSPGRREACTGWATGRQTWRDLLFLHWEVPVEALRALVPSALDIDTFEGRAYVGLVPFTMDRVRMGPVPLPTFLEVNVRTYVHAGGVPGVWFFSLDAASAFVVHAARALYRLPYFAARMHSESRGASIDYLSERSGRERAAIDVRWTVLEEAPHAAAPGTLEHFLTERYALYGPRRGGGVYRVRVHHTPWPLRSARVDRLETSLLGAAGLGGKEPIDLVLASPEGVNVETFARRAATD